MLRILDALVFSGLWVAMAAAALAALLGFRGGERYAHVVVDGALIAGASIVVAPA